MSTDSENETVHGLVDNTGLQDLAVIENIVPKTPTYDFSRAEHLMLEKFTEETSDDDKTKYPMKRIDKLYRLYLVGKNYREISEISKVKIGYVLHFSKMYRWTDLRTIYYNDLANSALSNLKNIHHQSIKTMSTIVNAFSLYFDEKFGKYIEKKENVAIENIDFKMLDKYYKVLEVTSKMFGDIKGSTGEFTKITESAKQSANTLKEATADGDGIIRDKLGNIKEIHVNKESSGDFLKNLASKK